MHKENLAIICNEKTYYDKKNYYCDNIDLKSIPEGLDENFNTTLFLRKSKIYRSSHHINIKNIFISNGIIEYIFKILKKKETFEKYLVISLSPFTFFACILLFIMKKKVYIYLRSNGYEEYKYYSKFFGSFIYHLMFTVVSWGAKFIACRSHILRNKKGLVVSPSQLSQKWFINKKTENLRKIKLLYVGRVKIEKGIFSLFKIIEKMNMNLTLSVINPEENYNHNIVSDKIKVIYFQNKNDSIINIYDDHNIFILPSFTEGHPQVLDESLARLRPVIIFPEISHVMRDRSGVFIAERNSNSLAEKIKYIMNNYESIQKKMLLNNLPTKKKFINELTEIIRN